MKLGTLVAVLGWFAATTACAQEPTRRSQLGVVTQWIAGTKVEITYRRPVAHGRPLFGALVPYGRTWTPSADSAARISTTGPIEINGAPLPAGTYSIWAIPDSSSWIVIFNHRANLFHLSVPSGDEALRVTAAPETGEHVETLMFTFPVADADSARLELRWGRTVVPLMIRAGR
ncbi:MAG TPA: DUF2911 domain-containing protein [Gemmatimonadaceae bacterium]|jgi:hypothetical protein|nr:DUF2911 domain-containing protein [Gemmatimonadaceae bacterium]